MQEAHLKRLRKLRDLLEGAGYNDALKALAFARRHHVGMRKDGVTPEFDHYPEMHGLSRMRSGLDSFTACCLGYASQARRAPAC